MKIKHFKALLSLLIISISALINFGCKKLVEAELPVDKVTAASVFNSVSGASAALANIFFLLHYNEIVGGESSASVMNGLTSDELILNNPNNDFLQSLADNTLSSKAFGVSSYWSKSYDLIYRINSILEGVKNSKGIPDTLKNELIGQAKFLRSYIYFYLVNLYGGVPLVLTTDYKINSVLARSSETEVYNQIINDLVESRNLVNKDYVKPDLVTISGERVTVNKAVVTAFLARVYLFVQRWSDAEAAATELIADSRYTISIPLNEVFLKNSPETIWQVEGDVSKMENSQDGVFFIPLSGSQSKAYLSDDLSEAFTSMDGRRAAWLAPVVVNSVIHYYPFKYRQRSGLGFETVEYNMVLRLGEQYLIRAEARSKLNNLVGATEDLNSIRRRADLPPLEFVDQSTLLIAVENERRLELFCESGHRWFDLNRTGRADVVLGAFKGGSWQPTDKLFPLPSEEFNLNPSLRGHQNPGYTEQ